MENKKMTLEEMHEWVEARGAILSKEHTREEVEAFIRYVCRMRNEKNPLEEAGQ